jgi:ligand-binding sensor domain-containing protein/two-component sensor histidine kinase
MIKQLSRKISFVSLFTILCFTAFSQSVYFRNYSVEDGLPFINVADIYQDSHGNLWSGGYGGLSKFDGNRFVNFSAKDGLLNHSVNTIVEDKLGNLWVGTVSGISKFDGQNFSTPAALQKFIGKSCTCSLLDEDGNVWLGTEDGLIRINETKYMFYKTTDGLCSNQINTLYQTKSKSILIGTNNGVSQLKYSNYTTPKFEAAYAKPITTSNINAIAEDEKQNVWIGTDDGLFQITSNAINSFGQKDNLPDKKINALYFDNSGVLWAATNKGLAQYKNNVWHHLPIQGTANSNWINCLYQDYEKNLWLGTYNGLYQYRGRPFVSYGINEGLFDNFIFGILRDSKQNLWVGTQSGLYLSNKFTGSYFIKQTNLSDIQVNQIMEFDKDELWIATEQGLRVLKNGNLVNKKNISSAFDEPIHCIYRDSENTLWLGGNNIIYRYRNSVFEECTIPQISSNAQVWSFVEDENKTLWIGTYLGGLFTIKIENQKMKSNQFVAMNKKIGLADDSYLNALKDKDNNLYFATLQGVVMLKKSNEEYRVTNFTVANGLSSDLVYSLMFDATQKKLWAGTNQGINEIDIDYFKQTNKKQIKKFGKQDGFAGVECNSNGTFLEANGNMWFGTVNGLIKFDPHEYSENIAEPKISIQEIKLFYKDTLLQENTILPYNENNISFTYNGICLTNPAKVLYSHILEGFEKEWSPATKERTVKYSNLSPGKYTFKVIATNNENVWSTHPVGFSFVIKKPYYKEWWFAFALFFTLFSIVLFMLRLRISSIKRREQEKTKMNEMIANIESQALRAQMNPHFIFNTLSSIQHYISSNDTDAALKYLSRFAKLMRKIMDNTKQPMIDVAEEKEALSLYLELEQMRFEKKFEYQIEINKNIDVNYDKIPSMLIQPYIENAIIHGLLPKQGNGKLHIEMNKKDQTIHCVITDNGIGRKQSEEFKKNRVHQHKSMGMNITKERLEILNASLNSNISVEIIDLYEDGKAAGTKVNLIIPLETNE